jgi:hypothetical protein
LSRSIGTLFSTRGPAFAAMIAVSPDYALRTSASRPRPRSVLRQSGSMGV